MNRSLSGTMERRETIVRSSLLLTGVTLCTIIANFLSQLVVAWLFGASAQLDAYFTAFALPSMVAGTLAAAIGYLLIPILAEHRGNERELIRVHSTGFLAVTFSALGVSLIGGLLSTLILRMAAPGLPSATLFIAVRLQRLFWLATSLSFVSSFCTAVYHSQKRFALPAAANLLPPVCTILGGVVLSAEVGIISLAVGYTLGAVLQVSLLLLAVRAEIHLPRGGMVSTARSFGANILPVLISLLPFTSIPVIDAFWASSLPVGSLSYLGYANRIVSGLTIIVCQGFVTVLFPFLAEHAASRDLDTVRANMMTALKFVFLPMVPLAGLFAVLRVPVLTVLFQRGGFDGRATVHLAAVLPWYLAGMVGMASMFLIGRGFYSFMDSKALAVIGVGSLAGYVVLSGVLSRHYSYVGIGMAYALYWNCQFAVASGYLSRKIGPLWNRQHVSFSVKLVGLSLSAGLVLYAVKVQIEHSVGPVGQLLGGAVCGLVLLLVVVRLSLDAEELTLMTRVMRELIIGEAVQSSRGVL